MKCSQISIVIPTCNEKKDSYLTKMARVYPSTPDIEYILVDQGTSKEILSFLNRPDFDIHSVHAPTRAERLNIGIHLAQSQMILCHHPRSIIEENGLRFLIENSSRLNWGGFSHSFDHQNFGLKLTSWYSNNIRPRFSKILYLDHCIFFKKELFKKDIPPIPIFEDTELSYILAKNGPPQILPYKATTSAIRFQTNGFFKQAIMNQKLKIDFHRGRSRQKMNQDYENNLNLNG